MICGGLDGRFIKGRGVQSIRRTGRDGGRLKLTLTDRKTVTADFVVVGKGVRPHVELALDFLSGRPEEFGIWTTAAKQGRVAGDVMAGGDAAFSGDRSCSRESSVRFMKRWRLAPTPLRLVLVEYFMRFVAGQGLTAGSLEYLTAGPDFRA